jgi:hypothetical protein
MRERTREREFMAQIIEAQRAERERSHTGEVVLKGRTRPFKLSRQGFVRHFLKPSRYTGEPVETALDSWIVFVQEVRNHSGKHRHQGGLVIYIIEGEGHSIVEGERLDWKTGDLLLLPLKPGGVEHQHFNKYPDKPVKWIAFIHTQIYEWCASEMVQIEKHPEWRGTE